MDNNTLYVTDMDGTLLTSESRVSLQSVRIINQLTDMGARVTVATARTPATVAEMLSGVRLALPAIVMTGAAMYDLGEGCYRNVCYLDPDVVKTALQMFDEAGVRPFVYTLRDDMIIHAFHDALMSPVEESFYVMRRDMKLKRFHIGERPDGNDMARTFLMFCVGEKKCFESLAVRMSEAIGYPITCYNDIFNDNTAFIEVFAPGVTKSRAVTDLAHSCGASRVVAFGDNLNDMSMMQAADIGVAVSNAYDEVKKSADVVIGSNNSDAVARWIYKDFTGDDWR